MSDKSGLCLYCGRWTIRKCPVDGGAECNQPDCMDRRTEPCGEYPGIVARIERLRNLAIELLVMYEDACWQGSGNKPLSSPTWHNFISTYEDADELIPRARKALATDNPTEP